MKLNKIDQLNKTVAQTLWRLAFVIPLMVVVQIPVFLAGVILGAVLFFSSGLPEIPELRQYQPRTVSTFYADDGTVIGIFYKQKRFVVDLSQIPDHVVKAFLAAEDSRFLEHSGVDWQGMARALTTNLKAWRIVQGGSTITMQVTRNCLLTSQKTVSRKMRELILALRLEQVWGKKKILYIYLNEIYLGEGCYGIEAASRNYFDKPVEHLTLAEGALVAGLVASPSRYNPFKSEEKGRQRQVTVLQRMLKAGFITPEQYKGAVQAPLEFRKEVPRPFDLVPDFAEVVRRYIVDKYGANRLYNEGLKVFTTCKIDDQKQAVEAVHKGLEDIKARRKHLSILRTVPEGRIRAVLQQRSTPTLKEGKLYQGVITQITKTKQETVLYVSFSPQLRGRVKLDKATSDFKIGHVLSVRFEKFINQIPYFSLDDDPRLQAALVAIENRTGYVRSIVGGASDEQFKFNRAVQGKRQPGSAFKPLIYAVALEKRSYSPATVIIDEPIEVELEGDRALWEPRNASGSFVGPISLRRALELSRNICTIKILMDVGLDPVINMAHKMGIKSRLGRNLSLSLGTSEVTLFELTSAYTVFPNSGVHVEPVLVKRIEDRLGNVLEDNARVPMLDESKIPRPTSRKEFKALRGVANQQHETGVINEDVIVEENIEGSELETETSEGCPTSSAGDETEEPRFQSRERAGPTRDRVPRGRPRKVTPVISPQTAYIITDILVGGVRSGTAANMRQYLKRKDLGGKTGTTNNAEDAWFIGFNPNYTTGVWVGFDEKRPLGEQEWGGRAALPIWGYFMKEILKNRPERNFPIPPKVTFVEMTTYTGSPREGFFPKIVREPVYSPFAGRTLVLSPFDTPEALRLYAGQAQRDASQGAAAAIHPPPAQTQPMALNPIPPPSSQQAVRPAETPAPTGTQQRQDPRYPTTLQGRIPYQVVEEEVEFDDTD